MSTTTSKARGPAGASKPAQSASTQKTSTGKTSTSATPAASKPAPPAAKKVAPTVVDAPQAVIVGPMMRKKELIDTVVARSGLKKKDVKPVVESILSVLGEALSDNRELNLPPLGRLKVRREKQLANGRIVVAKIRQPLPTVSETGTSPSADDDD